MGGEENFEVEDSTEAQEWVSTSASSEYRNTIERLKYQDRRAKLLFLRSLGRKERIRLRAKYNKS